MVPREVCAERSEKSNRYRKITLNVQKSAEAIVAGSFFRRRAESIGVLSTTGKGGMSRMGTENRESCSQRDSAERKGYVRAHRSFNRIPSDTDVYLESVETAKDTQTEADRIRAAGVGGLRRSIQPKSLLENGGKRSRAKSTNERKTDKLGLL